PRAAPHPLPLHDALPISTSLNVGGTLTSLGTVPLANLVGWRWALALWGLLAVVGTLYWTRLRGRHIAAATQAGTTPASPAEPPRSEEHTSELQSRFDLVC